MFTVRYAEGRTGVETQAGRVTLDLRDWAVNVGEGQQYAVGQGAPAGSANSLTSREKAGLILGIGAAIALVLIILAATDDEEIDVPSPPNPSPAT